MEVNFQQANNLLKKHADKLSVLPCIDPQYVLIDAKRDSSLTPVFFTYEDQDGFYYHAFHKSKILDTHFYDIQSPYGYGGPIATTEDSYFLTRAWNAYQTFCENQNIVAEFIRFHPLLENWKYYKGEVQFNRETVWIDLKVDDLIASYKENRVRTAVRKGIKNNVQTIFLDSKRFLPTFKKIYYDSMKRLSADTFYTFNDEYIDSLCAWENAYLAAAVHNEKIVAVLISLLQGDILELHLFGSTDESKQVSATNLIYHHTFEMAKEKGCHTVHFGGGTSHDMADPLFFFKLGYSDKKAQYKIGKFIHQPKIYAELEKNWQEKTGKKPTRILFYRD